MIRVENSDFHFSKGRALIRHMEIDTNDGDPDAARLLALLKELVEKATANAITAAYAKTREE